MNKAPFEKFRDLLSKRCSEYNYLESKGKGALYLEEQRKVNPEISEQ